MGTRWAGGEERDLPMGVHRLRRECFIAQLSVLGVRRYLGCYKTPQEARSAVVAELARVWPEEQKTPRCGPVFFVDAEFADEVSRHNWSVNGRGYLGAKVAGRTVTLHCFVFALAHGKRARIIDHINGNKLDNRLTNLRPACRALNGRNREKFRGGLPMGVVRSGGKFQAGIRIRKRRIYIGTFPTAELAHAAYMKARNDQIELEASAALAEFRAS